MAKKVAFTLPAGLVLDVSDGALTVAYDGDVVLEQSMGLPLERVDAGGDLTVRLAEIGGTLIAGGTLVAEGRIDAQRLTGREVVLGAGHITAKAISASERIVIGAAKLTVDVIIAPEIVIDPKASGRVTVLESRNERGPTKLKGGFGLKEYEEILGDASEFLAQRGVAPLEGGPVVRETPAEEETEASEEEIALEEPEEPEDEALADDAVPDDEEVVVMEESDEEEAEAEAAPAEEPAPDEEEVDDPLSLSFDDLEPVDDELHPKLSEALDRITSCYEGNDLPPAVLQLRELVDTRDYPQLRERITEVWNGLLGFHQKRGIRPHHQVTHAFNVIHGLVQEG